MEIFFLSSLFNLQALKKKIAKHHGEVTNIGKVTELRIELPTMHQHCAPNFKSAFDRTTIFYVYGSDDLEINKAFNVKFQ